MRELRCVYSNLALPPNGVILQFTLSKDLNSLGKHSLDFHLLNRVGSSG